ncbi:hypothetical protein F5H01DRAFT_413936 [Linnemannia elongata]|nr:hypothetical protein F5H01DRAFT_413936 [Linnemannia elongata]
MRIPSPDAARASTQAILLAYLCDRYHDLATYASESLKQRVHFMAKPDGSNLKDLFIWDTPLSTRSLGQIASPRWTPSQIQDYIHQHWSADQFPLHPPNNCNSWEAVEVYFKELDQETVQAMVPIGVQRDGENEVTLLVVLTAELDSGDQDKDSSEEGGRPVGGNVGGRSTSKQGERTVWKYHDMVTVNETNWEQNGWTILLPNHYQLQEPTSSDKHTGIGTDKQSGGDEEKNEQQDDEDDSDDDYWGQYGDAEDESAADEINGKSKHKQDPSGTTNKTPLDEDDEEELYWRKYSEQQEEQDELERKKKMQEQQQLLEHPPATAATGPHHLGPQESSKAPTPLPGQVDPNMLSSLLQSLVMEGVQQMYPTSFSELDQQQQGPLLQQQHHTTVNLPVATSVQDSVSPQPSAALLHKDNTSHLVDSGDSQSKLMGSMRSLIADLTRAGYTKDQVFAMIESIYNSQ